MESREHFEQFARDLAVRRRRAEAMSRSLRQHAAEQFAIARHERLERHERDSRDESPGAHATSYHADLDAGPDDRLGAVLIAEAAALTDMTIEELGRAEHELVQQNEALFNAQTQLDARSRHYYDLFELAPAAYLVTTDSGVIREINQAGAALLGRPRNFAVGKPLALFVAGGDERTAFRAALNRLRHATDVEVWRMRLVPGTRSPVDVTVSVRAVRDSHGAPKSLYWLIRDQSDRVADDLL